MVAAALERGLEVTGELELAWRLLPNRFVAVTGTNGKTTTVELLGAIWRAAGRPVAVAGNVGTPLASMVGVIDPEADVICEASSFQLEDASAFAPECAVLLNVEPDHLDRHGTLDRYRAAKMRIFANQRPGDTAIRPEDLAGAPPVPAGELALRGAHNAQNALRGCPGRRAMGVRRRRASPMRCAPSRGCPHRLEEVAEDRGVLYVNDSKATNVASAVRGIEAFDGGVHAILGRQPQGRRLRRAARGAGRPLPCRLPDRGGGRPAGGRPRGHRAAACNAGTLERAVADARGGRRRGRRGPAVARVRQLRRLPRLRGAG